MDMKLAFFYPLLPGNDTNHEVHCHIVKHYSSLSFCLQQLNFGSSDILWNMEEKRVSEVSLETKWVNKLNIEYDNPRALCDHLTLLDLGTEVRKKLNISDLSSCKYSFCVICQLI